MAKRIKRIKGLGLKKKHLKARLKLLEKKCECLELIVKWQSVRLTAQRETRLKQERERLLQ